MMSRFVKSTLVVVAMLFASVAKADDASDLKGLEKMVKMGDGPINEGKKDNRNAIKTGSVKDWLTYPGDVHVKPKSESEKYIGTIEYYFKGRERSADYVTGQQRATNDHQTSGKVTAEYEIGRSGKITVDNVVKHDGRGRVGNGVVEHIKSLQNRNVR